MMHSMGSLARITFTQCADFSEFENKVEEFACQEREGQLQELLFTAFLNFHRSYLGIAKLKEAGKKIRKIITSMKDPLLKDEINRFAQEVLIKVSFAAVHTYSTYPPTEPPARLKSEAGVWGRRGKELETKSENLEIPKYKARCFKSNSLEELKENPGFNLAKLELAVGNYLFSKEDLLLIKQAFLSLFREIMDSSLDEVSKRSDNRITENEFLAIIEEAGKKELIQRDFKLGQEFEQYYSKDSIEVKAAEIMGLTVRGQRGRATDKLMDYILRYLVSRTQEIGRLKMAWFQLMDNHDFRDLLICLYNQHSLTAANSD